MGTAQASGIALLIAARRGIPVALHTPSEVKASVTGSGRANKSTRRRDSAHLPPVYGREPPASVDWPASRRESLSHQSGG
jgi:hypothetical protein